MAKFKYKINDENDWYNINLKFSVGPEIESYKECAEYLSEKDDTESGEYPDEKIFTILKEGDTIPQKFIFYLENIRKYTAVKNNYDR